MLHLNEIAAGVVKDCYGHLTIHFCWLHRELHTPFFKLFIFCTDVLNTKGRGRDALFKYSFLVCLCYWIVVLLKQKLGPVLIVRGNDGKPPLLSSSNIILFHKAQHFGVEFHSLVLIMNTLLIYIAHIHCSLLMQTAAMHQQLGCGGA